VVHHGTHLAETQMAERATDSGRQRCGSPRRRARGITLAVRVYASDHWSQAFGHSSCRVATGPGLPRAVVRLWHSNRYARPMGRLPRVLALPSLKGGRYSRLCVQHLHSDEAMLSEEEEKTMASRIQERPRERERVPERERLPEEELRLEPMLDDRDYEKLYGMRAWLRDRVRLAPVFAGLFVAFATNVLLTALGVWVGFITAPATATGGIPIGLATGLAVWVGISSVLSLFLGGWYAARTAGVAGRFDGIMNGLAVWATFIVFGVLLSSITGLLGVGSLATFGIGAAGGTVDLLRALNLTGLGTVTPEQAIAIRSAISSAALALWLGTLIAAGAAIAGGWVGARSRKVHVRPGTPA